MMKSEYKKLKNHAIRQIELSNNFERIIDEHKLILMLLDDYEKMDKKINNLIEHLKEYRDLLKLEGKDNLIDIAGSINYIIDSIDVIITQYENDLSFEVEIIKKEKK